MQGAAPGAPPGRVGPGPEGGRPAPRGEGPCATLSRRKRKRGETPGLCIRLESKGMGEKSPTLDVLLRWVRAPKPKAVRQQKAAQGRGHDRRLEGETPILSVAAEGAVGGSALSQRERAAPVGHGAPSACGRDTGRAPAAQTHAHLGRSAVVLAAAQDDHVGAHTAEAASQPLQHVVTHHPEGPGCDRGGRVPACGDRHLQHGPAQQPRPLGPTLDSRGAGAPRPCGPSFFKKKKLYRES